ncbi:CynX/NimT family MFS transporter [Actinomadura flavalba]|uniref:CynX/NimT family MFS transporter n=1 Tax=Actinomadura flavalba TaxID=1120938 RepID=UPI0003A25DBA|nr:MFS transporter [Actinomadura flavalba]
MTSRRAATLTGVALIILAAFNLRPAITMVGPLLPEIRADVALSGTAAGALTTLPLAFLGAYGLLAPLLRRTPGGEALLVAAMALLIGGVTLRLLDAPLPLFAGSLVAGLAISIGNIAIPAIIKRDHPGRIASVTSVYTVAITFGAAGSTAVAVPLAAAVGGWRTALALLVVPAALALVAWLPRAVRSPWAPRRVVTGTPLWRSPLAWAVTGFMGTQSLLAYVVIAWLPTFLHERGLSEQAAGFAMALSTLTQAAGALAVPVVAARARDQRPLVLAVVGLSAAGFAGLAWAPLGSVWAWAVVLGLGQGIAFAAALSFIGLRSHDAGTAARLSGMAQGCGYVIAGLGPLGIGALHDATGGWNVPWAVLLGIVAFLTVPGLAAARSRTVGAPDDAPALSESPV